MGQRLEYTVLGLIEDALRTIKASPMNLGGTGGGGGGIGGPPGGFIGQLPQYRVTYDQTEAATLSTLPSGLNPPSGWSLLDNLNHIRYRLGVVESGILIVDDWDGSPTIQHVQEITFSGATVTQIGTGHALVVFSGGGSALTVEEADGSPSVNNVDKIIFSGAMVTNLGSGDVLVTISGISGATLITENLSSQVPGTHFTISNAAIDGTIRVYHNGVRQPPYGNYSADIGGAGFTTDFTVETGDTLVVDYNEVAMSGVLGSNKFYIDQSGGTSDTYGVLSGAVNGSNTLYTVSQASYVSSSLKVYLNGQLQTQGTSEDWVQTSPSTGTFTFNTAPLTGDLITVEYMKTDVTTSNADTVDGYHASSLAKLGEANTFTKNQVIDNNSGYELIIKNTTGDSALAFAAGTGTGSMLVTNAAVNVYKPAIIDASEVHLRISGADKLVLDNTGRADIANGIVTATNLVMGYNATLANLSAISIPQFRGMLLVSDVTGDATQLIICTAAGSFTSLGGSLSCNLNSDAGATIAVFISGGNFLVKNRYGASRTVRVQTFGN